MKMTCHAVLLIGPTGSGKTPLGRALERAGYRGRRAAHFDFGAHLRAAVKEPAKYPALSSADVTLLESKLTGNSLLEDNEFHIAEKILISFVQQRRLSNGECVILNGLPRHAGQAAALPPLLDVEEVIYLECTAETVKQRIAVNAGGDRTRRSDDSMEEIERKLAIFSGRTLPLLTFYRTRGVPVRTILVRPGMKPDEVFATVSR